jgi:hypothetical protein
MTIEVIGGGFGRTGTLSLKQALETIGFGPTYHMREVMQRPSHIARWHEYAVTGRMDWESLFDRYRSCVDFPASCAWRELTDHYPNAKVVLTTRDPDQWWESTATTIYPLTHTAFPQWLRKLAPPVDHWLDMVDRLVWNGIFNGRFEDRDYAIEVFERHISTVRADVPSSKLLVFDVRDGWAPLCDFLDVPRPPDEFPHVNDAAAVRRLTTAIRVGNWMMPVAGLCLGGYLLHDRLRVRTDDDDRSEARQMQPVAT